MKFQIPEFSISRMYNYFKRILCDLFSDRRFSEILAGSLWALSARGLSTLMALAFSILVVQLFGAKVVGIVAVVNSFLMLVTIFTLLGTGTSILRLIPEHIVKYSLSSAFAVYRKTQYMVISISLVTATVFFLSSSLLADKVFSKPHFSTYFALASIFVVFRSLMLLNNGAIRGLRLIRTFALMQVLPQAFNLLFLCAFCLLYPTEDSPVYAVLFSVAMTGLAGWLIMEHVFKKRMRLNDKIHNIPCRKILATSLPMLMSDTMIFIIAQTGVIMLGIFRSEAEVGYYAIAVKLASLPVFVLHAVNSMAGPRFSELFHSEKLSELLNMAKKSAELIFFTTTPFLIILIVFGKTILQIIFGHDFAIAYPALVLLITGQFVNSIAGTSGIFLNMTGNQIAYKNIMIISAVINIGLNLLLINRFGINGAAFAAMSSIVMYNIVSLIYIKIHFGKAIVNLQ